ACDLRLGQSGTLAGPSHLVCQAAQSRSGQRRPQTSLDRPETGALERLNAGPPARRMPRYLIEFVNGAASTAVSMFCHTSYAVITKIHDSRSAKTSVASSSRQTTNRRRPTRVLPVVTTVPSLRMR